MLLLYFVFTIVAICAVHLFDVSITAMAADVNMSPAIIRAYYLYIFLYFTYIPVIVAFRKVFLLFLKIIG